MKGHLEIEAKYDVDDGQPLPDLIGVGAVSDAVAQSPVVLTATYFDTMSHALSAAGATLRRRTGGEDDGWHLKLSVAEGERLEVHRPLGRGQHPPCALTSLVRVLVGTQDLGVVATLTTRRTVHRLLDGDCRALADLADDTVTAERLDADLPAVSWREVEIELLAGDRELLAALDATMRAQGVSPAASSSKVGRVLTAPPAASAPGARVPRKAPVGEVLHQGVRHATRVVLTSDPLLRVDHAGAAHRMRAAVRQLRAALALQRQVTPKAAAESLRSELMWLDSAVARLADIDSADPRIRAALAGQPEDLLQGPVSHRIERELAAARRTAGAAVREVLDSQRYLRLMHAVEDRAAAGPGAATVELARDVLPALAERAVRRAQRRLGQLLRAQSQGERAWQLIGARQAVERARYAVELSPDRGTGAGTTSALLDSIVEVLAEMDLAARTQTLLRELAVKAQLAGESSFTFGRLHGVEELHAAELSRRLKALRKALRRVRTS